MKKTIEEVNVGRILGIDLGTTNSTITLYDGDTEEFITVKDRNGKEIVPSLFFLRHNTLRIGEDARELVKTYPDNLVSSVKSHMDDPAFRFLIPEAWGNPKEGNDLRDGDMAPLEVTKYILQYIKTIAEEFIMERFGIETIQEARITDVVITVPAYFREVERKTTERAATLAGLNVIELINEPTAACLAYGYATDPGEDTKTIMVYDFGGGTFDVTILEMSAYDYDVVVTDGDKIGGDNLDLAFLEYIKGKGNIGTASDKQARFLVEEAKKALSTEDKTIVDFTIYGGEPIEVTRRQFNNQIEGIVMQTIVKVENLMAGIKIDEVVLVGGSTRVPLVRQKLVGLLGFDSNYFDKYKIDPDLAISVGACQRGRIISGDTDIILTDRTPFNLGIEQNDGSLISIIKRGSTIPTRGRQDVIPIEGYDVLKFRVYQGNEYIANQNQYLGEIELEIDGIITQTVYQVIMQLDSSGLLTIIVKNTMTQEESKLEVTGVVDEKTLRN